MFCFYNSAKLNNWSKSNKAIFAGCCGQNRYFCKITYSYQEESGAWQTTSREVYNRGNAATILLWNKEQNTVILTRQFRLPTFLNENKDGMLVEDFQSARYCK